MKTGRRSTCPPPNPRLRPADKHPLRSSGLAFPARVLEPDSDETKALRALTRAREVSIHRIEPDRC